MIEFSMQPSQNPSMVPQVNRPTLQSVTDVGSTTNKIITVPGVQFDINATPATNAEGLLQWDATDGTLGLGMNGGTITQQIGQELFIKVRNASGSTIANGTPVYFNGRQGNRPKIYPAKADTEATSMVMGITTDDIADNSDGFITTFGYVRQIKTNYTGSGVWGTTWVEGDQLWVSKTNAGQLTNVEPTVPHHSCMVGYVGVIGGAGIGSILISLRHHQTLEGLSNVNGTPLTTSGQIPVWNQTAGYFDFDKNILDYFKMSYVAKTANYTLTATDYLVDCTANSFTVTLPTAVGITGRRYEIKNSGNGTIIINTTSSQTIDGQLTQTLTQYDGVTVVSNGTNWIII